MLVVLVTLMAGAARADDWAPESREMADAPGTHISREPTAAATCRELAVQQAFDGDISEAKRTAEHISYAPSKAAAFGAIAVIQARATPLHVSEAKRTAEHISYKPYKLAAFREIARAQAEAGDIAEAKRTAARIGL